MESEPANTGLRSRTSLLWDNQWPIRPDVTFEGGNLAVDEPDSFGMDIDELQILTTYHKPNVRQFNLFGDTSAATALGSYMAARIWAEYPEYWAETVRALIVHSAEWTPAMCRHLPKKASQSKKINILLRRYGYGVPNLERALFSSKSDLTMIFEDQLQPFLKIGSNPTKTHKMNFHQLPLPMEELKKLHETEVEMRVTLSYFVQPNPGERGQQQKHSYTSHGLRFAVKRSLETLADFKLRINQVEKNKTKDLAQSINKEEKNVYVQQTDSEDTGWFLGANTWNRSGSINSDIWRGTAADLAERDAIAIYPVTGWWKYNRREEGWNNIARYTLIVSIRVINKAEVDIYTPVAIKVGQSVAIST
ncbi:S8 family serine peptidase [Nostoc sp.]